MRAFVLGLVVSAALAAASGASASIVPNRSVGGVSLGQTRAHVRGALGRPLSVRRGRNEFGRYTVFRYTRVTVTFQGNGGATSLATTSPRERTAYGIGVGSTQAQVKSGVRGARCSRFGALHHCTLGRELPGRRVTDFLLRRGRVVRVVVGLVID